MAAPWRPIERRARLKLGELLVEENAAAAERTSRTTSRGVRPRRLVWSGSIVSVATSLPLRTTLLVSCSRAVRQPLLPCSANVWFVCRRG